MEKGRILIADGNPNMLGGIRRLLENEIEAVLMVGDENSLYYALENSNPDLVVAESLAPGFRGNKHRVGPQEKVS